MTTPYRDMEEAWWDFLADDGRFRELGLRQFRTYDGTKLPFQTDDGRWPADSLPAISLELASFDQILDDSNNDVTGPTLMGYRLALQAHGIMVYQGPERDGFENAIVQMTNILHGQRAHREHLGSDLIGRSSFSIGEVRAVSARNARGLISFWEAEFDVELWAALRTIVP